MEVLVFTPLVPSASSGEVGGQGWLLQESREEFAPEGAGVTDRCLMRRRVDRGEGDGPKAQGDEGRRVSAGMWDDTDGVGGGAVAAGVDGGSGVGLEVLHRLSSRGVPFDFDTAGFSFDDDKGDCDEGEG